MHLQLRPYYRRAQLIRPMTPLEDTLIEELRLQGRSLAQIAAHMSRWHPRSPSTILKALQRLARAAEGEA